MKLSRKWLNEFVDLASVNDREFAEGMTLSGSKVEVTEVLNESLKNVVAGRIEKMERHPDSDHMWICQINVGEEELVQIVTGAWNVHVGDMVPWQSTSPCSPAASKSKRASSAAYLPSACSAPLRNWALL